MKKIFAFFAFSLFCLELSAVPADPTPKKIVHPDGSVITIIMHGDEYCGWATEASTGDIVEQGSDGIYRKVADAGKYLRVKKAEGLKLRSQADKERAAMRAASALSPMTEGTRHIPVILVQFSDLSFVISNPKTAFGNLLNQSGYSENGASGSVNDFYVDNSGGVFNPVFDVYGPVTVSGKQADYGNSVGTNAARSCFKEAMRSLDSTIDYSQYDYDSDGYIDMILFYYAGHNTAEGGGNNTIWPHQSYLYGDGSYITVDGKRGARYFCTSELKSASGSNMCGIGTTCHEFAHSLGLPDFYDTDYEENGQAGALYTYSTMCSGSYNTNGTRPPYFNAEERRMLGWMGDSQFRQISVSQSVTLKGIEENDFVVTTPVPGNDGEYFLYECRSGKGWDQGLRGGLLVYHVDKSSTKVGDYTAYNLWYNWEYSNAINAYGSHPCFYIVPAPDQSNLAYGGSAANLPFPGASNRTSFTPVGWAGSETGYSVSGISFSSYQVQATFEVAGIERKLKGVVTDSKGKAVGGAKLSLVRKSGSNSVQGFRLPMPDLSDLVTVTSALGSYEFDLGEEPSDNFTLYVAKEGYVTHTQDVSADSGSKTVNVRLYAFGEDNESNLRLYGGGNYLTVGTGSTSFMAAFSMNSQQLADYVGNTVNSVTFYLYCSGYTDAYIVIDFGSKRVLNYRIDANLENGMQTIDISDAGLTIPEGKTVYFGYALNGISTSDYPIVCEDSDYQSGYYSSYSLTSSNWQTLTVSSGVSYNSVISAMVKGPDTSLNITNAGVNTISNPKSSYNVGDYFKLEVKAATGREPESVSWFFDDSPVNASSVLLKSSGWHSVKAILTYADSSTETLFLEIEAK